MQLHEIGDREGFGLWEMVTVGWCRLWCNPWIALTIRCQSQASVYAEVIGVSLTSCARPTIRAVNLFQTFSKMAKSLGR